MTFHDVLNRLDLWLEANASTERHVLNPPATARRIGEIAENRFALDPELRLWLSRHDGVSTWARPGGPGGLLPGGHYPLDAEGMRLGQRDMEQAVAWSLEDGDADSVVGTTAHVRWVPLARTLTGTELVVDHREGPTRGAVLEIDQDLEIWGAVRWKSVAELFEQTVTSLETGRPIVTATGREIRAEYVQEDDGVRQLVWG
ncbi:hypothetical protein [Streptomyces lanatus]|uniref:Cell wall assembly regulator SMI1 n=1 Tax=Streptomyces lanatus TaxID=66900 RepID=A0ABV1XJA0_9ACTN|nr:hypothetical protein [Streptomyces lanatus]GHG91947.1 hypothetical protein GCM10018780_13030 [Streptomyces lanatus]